MKGMGRNLNVNEIASLGSNVKPVIQNENCAVLIKWRWMTMCSIKIHLDLNLREWW